MAMTRLLLLAGMAMTGLVDLDRARAADIPVKALPAAVAYREASGYVEVYGGWTRTKVEEEVCNPTCSSFVQNPANGWTLGGAGRATYWWLANASLQLDAQGEGTSTSATLGSSTQRVSSHGYLIGGHVNWRDPQRGLVGVFGGAGDTTFAPQFSVSSVRHGLVGVEAQLYLGMLTLYGQAGYNTTLGQLSTFVDAFHAWFVRGTARLYINPNLRIEGTVLYGDGSLDYAVPTSDTFDFQTWLWRAKAEHRLANAPFAVFVAYEGSRAKFHQAFSGSIDTRISDQRVTGGIRLYLGENTLVVNDRQGTTLDIIAPLSVPSMSYTYPTVQ